MTPPQFEALAAAVMSRRYGVALAPARITGVPKRWDLVSTDGDVVGDAKYYTLGDSNPSGKLATISEYVWLLEKVPARRRFLVFGNDDQVPTRWLKSYRSLLRGISFFFILSDGSLVVMHGSAPGESGRL